jgi:N-acetylglucosaminyldiphosphoundecaprenol N-acetyl-beta-D-mannosaminyltransferase
MTTWLNEQTVNADASKISAASVASRATKAGATTTTTTTTAADRVLRAIDATVAAALLLPLALPLALLRRHWQREEALGRHGVRFERFGLALPATRVGRALAAVGAAHWPLLLNILRGDMAWVGPRVRLSGETASTGCSALRPGIVNPWFIRRRTAVDFGTEAEADLHYLARRGVRHDLGLLLRGSLVALLPPPLAGEINGRVQLGDVAFDNLDMNEAVDRIRVLLDGTQAQQVSFVNPACVNNAASHRGYRRVLARAALVLPDGIGTKIGSDLLGTPLKQNVNGTDLFPRLCELLQARGASVFLLGGQTGVAEQVAAQISQRWPSLRVAGVRHGFFSVAEEGDVAAQVRASGADLLLVARGAPAQDLFIDRYLPQLGVKVAMGVGGLFDFVSGRISRAPQWMRETGLEWVWRLLQEPGRMWRRYLLGNFTFLGRVLLQRVGLRRLAADTLPATRPATGEVVIGGVRAVIFATPRAPTDMPVSADTPAALLPLGCQTVIEQLLANLAQAAILDVSLVVCEQPETLRALLGDGSRWGLRLHWHLVKDPAHPYGVLAHSTLRQAQRIVIGHADRCPSVGMLLRLAESDQVLLDADPEQGPQWSGWASIAPERMRDQGTHLLRAELGVALQANGVPSRLSQRGDGLALHSAAMLRQAQPGASSELGAGDIPPSWIRQPWGAMSPLARVSPGAVLTGPVLVGPGCIVERGAKVGPDVVLSHNVVVSTNTWIEHSLVLSNTYIGTGLDLCGTIVNGARVRHLQLGVESSMPAADAVLLDLAASADQGPSWFGRMAAVAALTLSGPALAWHVTRCRLAGHGPGWTLRDVVSGRDAHSQVLRTTLLHVPRPGAQRAALVWAGLAGLIDVAAGRRRWFGSRPRTPGQWYALRPEWQQMLSNSMVGLLHAPAWEDVPALRAESFAIADVYATSLPPTRRAWALVSALMRAIENRGLQNA